MLVDVALRQGDYATARAAGEEALACVRATGEGLAIASLLGSLADVAQLEGDDLRLERLCTESLELQRKLPDRAGVARSLLGLARVALRRNDAGRAASLCAEALARSGAGTHKPGAALGLATLASVAESQGPPAMAARMAGAADALIEAAGFPPWPAERMEYERGLPLRLELCERFPADWAQGRTMSLAEAVELGRSTAVTLQGLATTDLHAAASHPSPPSDPDGLTARQVEILDLLAASRNNTEIAAALVPSIRTIERHVENIYEKLGIHGNAARARVAAYALRRGPAGAGDSRQKRRQVSLCIDPSSPVGRVTVRLRRISCAFENTRFARLTCASERMPAFACSPYTPDAGWLAGCRRRRPPAWRRASRHQSV
ncbi:MAG TPA: LuxR family transcriptional regulator [Steroidobacteraceae bacterium]|nr:LuxR family transcriptional regulator [Steroidobacteraceae bacterium]